MLKRVMVYLGLGPDEHYDNYDDPIRSAQYPNAQRARPSGGGAVASPYGAVSVSPGQTPTSAVHGQTVRPISLAASGGQLTHPNHDSDRLPGVVHSIEAKPMKPHAVSPSAFNDAQEIGDRFKSGQAVIVNLQTIDRDLRRRLVDFSSGLCYAMGGKMDRVADQVYLLTPAAHASMEPRRPSSQ